MKSYVITKIDGNNMEQKIILATLYHIIVMVCSHRTFVIYNSFTSLFSLSKVTEIEFCLLNLLMDIYN